MKVRTSGSSLDVIEFDDPKKFLELSEDIGPKIIDTLEIEYPDTWNYTGISLCHVAPINDND